jgi:large subunit ribosomal protein L9
LNSKVAMLAERLKSTHLTITARSHDNGKLYGSIGSDEIVELLKGKDVTVNKKQIVFGKAIRSVGEHKVIVKLSSKLQPQVLVKVVSKA